MPMKVERIRVDLGPRSYDIAVGADLLAALPRLLSFPSGSRKAAVVTDANVAPLYAESVQAGLEDAGCETFLTVIDAGEEMKSPATLAFLWNALLEAGLNRRDLVVALGGGVVGDLAGFAAGSYMRGVPYVQVPTTLLAQVDSSVGGKTAVNLPGGKNMAGLFYQPAGVLIDVATLKSLPEREFRAGLAEAVKYGIMWDEDFFRFFEHNLDAVLARDPAALVHLVTRSCTIKAQVVSSDETEAGLRRVLNLGHTAGHAVEAAAGYGAYLHGEAVAWGLVFAARLAAELGVFNHAGADRVEALLHRLGCVPERPALALDRVLGFLGRDKKAVAGRLVWVLPQSVGRVIVTDAVAEDTLLAVLKGHLAGG